MGDRLNIFAPELIIGTARFDRTLQERRHVGWSMIPPSAFAESVRRWHRRQDDRLVVASDAEKDPTAFRATTFCIQPSKWRREDNWRQLVYSRNSIWRFGCVRPFKYSTSLR